MCKCHLAELPEAFDLRGKVETMLLRMKTMKQILLCDSERWPDWQSIYTICEQGSPEIVLRRLVEIKQYDLAREVSTQYSSKVPSDLLFFIEESFLSHLLTVAMNFGAALEAMVALGSKAKGIISTLLQKMKEFSTKLFLVQVLLIYFRKDLDDPELRVFTAKELGLQILTRFVQKQEEKQD